MAHHSKRARIILTVAIVISSIINSYSQSQKKEILYKYVNTDTLLSYKNCVLILYNDNSYLNYGLFSNSAEKEWYVWYSSGRWINQETKLLLKSYSPTQSLDKVIKDILSEYKKLPNYTLIEKYYEYVSFTYEDYVLEKKESNMLDESKKINYTVSKL